MCQMQRSKCLAALLLTLLLGSALWPAAALCEVRSWYTDPIIDGPDPVGFVDPIIVDDGSPFLPPTRTHDGGKAESAWGSDYIGRSGAPSRLLYCPSSDDTCMECRRRALASGCPTCAYLIYYYTDTTGVVHCVWATFETVRTRP